MRLATKQEQLEKPLDYERSSGRWFSRRSQRWLIAVAILLILVHFWRSPLASLPSRIGTRVWINRCAQYTLPATAVVYEEHNELNPDRSNQKSLSMSDASGTRRYVSVPDCFVHLFG